MKLSSYILTCNSELYLEKILTQLSKFADEIVVLDCGSTDSTLSIAKQFPLVRTFYRAFDNFKEQRNHATSLCQYDTVFYVDSDEIPDDTLAQSMNAIKAEAETLGSTGYAVKRQWYVMGRPVHSIYPIESPDYDIRLFDRRHVCFDEHSNLVHETLSGYSERKVLEGTLIHRTFQNKEEIQKKLDHYTTLAAHDLIRRKGKVTPVKVALSPSAAFLKWYFTKRGFLDGRVGLITGCYAYRYTKMKYQKAIGILHDKQTVNISSKQTI